MCVVSMIHDYYNRLPEYRPGSQYFTPGAIPSEQTVNLPIPRPQFTDEQVAALIRLIEVAKDTDKAMGEPDCEDPKKTDWLKPIMDRFDKLEKKIP